MLQGQ